MKYVKFSLFLLCIAVLAGCIRDELLECSTTLTFSYKGDGTVDIFSEHVKGMELYVFDEKSHELIKGFAPYILTSQEVAAQKVELMLPTARSYNVVAVGNMEDMELYSLYEGTIDSTKILHPQHEVINGNGDIDTHPHLYLGRGLVNVPVRAGSTHAIEMSSQHVDMIVEVAGLDGPSTRQDGGSLSLEHGNMPGWTDFKLNCICPNGDLISQTLGGEWDEERGVWVFSYQVMRDLKGGKDELGSYLQLYNGDENLLGDNTVDVEAFIQEELMTNPDIAGPRDANGVLLQEALVPIRIEFKAVGVEVSIPDWALVGTTPIF